jgi:hypothetical protein
MLAVAAMGICFGLGLGVQVPTSARGPLFEVKADVNSPSGKSLGTSRLRLHAYEAGTVTVGPHNRSITLTATVKAPARAHCRHVDLLVNQTEIQSAGLIRKTEAGTDVIACEGQLRVLAFSEGPSITFTLSAVTE